MATWVTHLMIADEILKRFPKLDRRGFCVGNIAPDCNVENGDWTAFTPSREVTHWMRGGRKKASDCDAFREAYLLNRRDQIQSMEHFAFLLGYYAHLIVDASFQAFVRDEARVRAVWRRIRENGQLCSISGHMEETWDSVKRLIPKREWMRGIYVMEGEYLKAHPDSGYLTEILPLKSFPNYIDYLPEGSIVRKIGVMGYLPGADDPAAEFIAISREEYRDFTERTIRMVEEKFRPLGKSLYGFAMKHIYGDGVAEDNELALKLLTWARALGCVEATYNLGICCHYGYGTDADLAMAYGLYLESAERGYGKGMELVGRFYNRGIHVEKNREQAELWLRRAMESDDPDAAEEARKELARSE